MRALFRQFSFPGGIPSHVAPETPGLDPRGRRARLLARRTPTARRSTTPTCSSPASSATARPRPARWPRAGTPTSSSTRSTTARCCRSCTSTATRSPTRRCWRGSREERAARPDARLRLRAATSSTGDDPAAVHQALAATLDDGARRRSPRSSARRAAAAADGDAAALADDRAAHAEGLDRARRRSTACRSRAPAAPTRCRSPATRTNPEHLAQLEDVAAQLPARGAVRRATARCVPELARARPDRRPPDEREPARQRRPAAARPRPARLPRLRRRRRRSPATSVERGDARARRASCATSSTATRDRFRLMGPDETASNRLRRRLRGDRPGLGRRAPSPGDDHLAPDGRVMEVLSRAPVPGLARGLPAHRPARPVQLLRGVHPHRRLDVQPARQVAEGHARHPVAAADRLAELPALLARLAAGPQRLLAPGPGLHRPRREQEGRDRPRLPAAGRQHPAVGRRPLPAQPRLRQRHRRRQAAGARPT